MSFAATRRFLFQVHMWIGLILGLLLALLGLSGSILVYDDAIANFLSPPPAATARGEALSLDRIAEAARGVAGRGVTQIVLPQEAGEAIVVRVGQMSPMGPMPAQREAGGGRRARAEGERRPAEGARPGMQVFVDPVSGAVLGTRKAMLPPHPDIRASAARQFPDGPRWPLFCRLAGRCDVDIGRSRAWCCGGPSAVNGNTPSSCAAPPPACAFIASCMRQRASGSSWSSWR